MKNGFTIIELIISIFILSVAVVGIFSAFSIMVILTSDAADRLTATYLAQEGMEIVRNIRDTNWLNMDTCAGDTCAYAWSDGLSICDTNSGSLGCEADYTATTMSPWSGNYLNMKNGFYVEDATNPSPTKFQRKIIIGPIEDADGGSDHIMMVQVQVSWNQKATIINSAVLADTCLASNCIAAKETLYDWYNYINE